MMLRIVTAALAFAFAADALANDTIARVGAGGIEFTKSVDVRMLEEVLTISQRQVRVRYRFRDEGDADVHATIAFPMPRYRDRNVEAGIESNVHALEGFVVKADGVPVATRRMRRALVGERDVTAQLREIGLDDTQVFETFGRLPTEGHELGFTEAQQARLRALLGPQAAPNGWEVEETRLWEQTFPAHREGVVEHAYAPLVGGVYDAPFQRGYPLAVDEELRPSTLAPDGASHPPAEACVGADVKAAIERRVRALAAGGARFVMRELSDVEYILGTGRNWKGPIGAFTLRVEKERPDDIVSLCFPGQPVRVDATTLEFRARDLVPQDRVVVYFYRIRADGATD